MRLRLLAATAASASVLSGPARAEPDTTTRRLELGAAFGYGAPVGSAERGARLGDTTIGIVPLRLDAGIRLSPSVAVAVAASYSPAIPTLCRTASDCIASFGHDVALSLRVRVFLARIGPTVPRVEFGVGYEWLTTKLVDNGATSTRAYQGPLLAVLEVVAPFRIGSGFTIGPAVGTAAGVFASESLEAPGILQSSSVHGRAAHAWLTLGLRVGVELP